MYLGGLEFFSLEKLSEKTRNQAWERIRITCSQPFRWDEHQPGNTRAIVPVIIAAVLILLKILLAPSSFSFFLGFSTSYGTKPICSFFRLFTAILWVTLPNVFPAFHVALFLLSFLLSLVLAVHAVGTGSVVNPFLILLLFRSYSFAALTPFYRRGGGIYILYVLSLLSATTFLPIGSKIY
jgi:hypothetical protein